uniref:Uncharacterized protein n=1 Tax=Knipowitschia caucasica TaxID=637954 RepID=A0AAV2MJ36_KNICA
MAFRGLESCWTGDINVQCSVEHDLSRDAELKVKSQTALRNRPFYLRRWPVTHLDTQWTSDTPGHALDPPWTSDTPGPALDQ